MKSIVFKDRTSQQYAHSFFRRAYAFEKLGDQENCSKDIEKYMELKLNHSENLRKSTDEEIQKSISRLGQIK